MNGDFKGKQWLIGVIGILATVIGLLSGLIIDFTFYRDKINQNAIDITDIKHYMDNTLRPQIQKKMDKGIAWEQINQLRREIQYLDHLHIGKTS